MAVAEHGGEIVDLLQRRAGAVALIGLRAVADRREIGHEILPVLRRQAEIEHAIEMRHHLIVGVEAAVVKIGRVEIGVAQRRRLEQPA